MADQAGAPAHHNDEHHDEHHTHAVPLWILLGTGGALLFLTWVTVAATWFDFGAFNLMIALAIATVKGSLVLLFFMHLYWDKPFNSLVFVGSLFFVALFLGIVLMDRAEYQETLDPALYEQVTERPELYQQSAP